MDYKKIYDQLVDKAKVRGLDRKSVDYYTEIHHIVPKSMGGSDDNSNLVMFTGREHFVAHMLLWKAYPEEVSLMRAAFMMSSRWKSGGFEESRPIHSRTYSILREEYAEAVKEQCSGEGNPFYGKTHSEETRAKFRKWHLENKDFKIKALAKKAGISVEEYRKVSRDKIRLKSKFYVHESLEFWKENNSKYMEQFSPRSYKRDHEEHDRSLPHHSLSNPEVKDRWNLFYLYKDFWELCGRPKARVLTDEINAVFGTDVSIGAIKTLVKRFDDGWEPDGEWLAFLLNNKPSESLYIETKLKLSESSVQKKEKFFSDWMKNRDINRNKIVDVLDKLEIVQHKNSIGDNSTLSLIDAAEANILWKSNLVQKKTIADLLGVRPNTISQSTSEGLRWKEITSNIDLILKEFYSESEYSRPPVEIPG